MNLMELSVKLNCSEEQLNQFLYENHNRIILSKVKELDKDTIRILSSGISAKQNTMNTESTTQLLKYCVENDVLIFIDTCSLLSGYFLNFYKNFKNIAATSSLYIPYIVIEELKNISVDHRKEHFLQLKAQKILTFILKEMKEGYIQIVGNEDDMRINHGKTVAHADRIFIEKLIYYRNHEKNTLLITQDHNVTVDALKQNNCCSTKLDAWIFVKKLGRGGTLIDNAEDTPNPVLPVNYHN